MAEAKTPNPPISNLKVAPSVVTTTNGSVSITATVSNASSCTLSSALPVPGLPLTVSCGGAFNQTVIVPQDIGTKARKDKFTLIAAGSGGTKSKNVSVTTEPGAGQPFPTGSTATYVGPDDAGIDTGASLTLQGKMDPSLPCSSDPGIGVCNYVWTDVSGSWFNPNLCGGQEVTADPTTMTGSGAIQFSSRFAAGFAGWPGGQPFPLGVRRSQFSSAGGGTFTVNWTH